MTKRERQYHNFQKHFGTPERMYKSFLCFGQPKPREFWWAEHYTVGNQKAAPPPDGQPVTITIHRQALNK